MPRPFPVAATICTVAGVAVLCSLGTWQYERLGWKLALQAALDKEFSKDASQIPLTAADLAALDRNSVRRGTLTGKLDFDHQVILRGQLAGGKAVNYVLVPMTLADRTPVFVVTSYQSGLDLIPEPAPRAQTDRVTGTARLPSWSSFASENVPEAGEWYRPDVIAMARQQSLPAPAPALFYMESSNYKLDARPVVEVPRQLKNEHRHYMFFWFTMAAVLLAIYFLRFWRTPPAPQSQ